MKKTTTLFSFICMIGVLALIESCGSKREPGRTYMPDMQYSRAYEAYAANNLYDEGVNYVPYPVEGTIRRGDLFPYNLPDNAEGFVLSAQVKNPLPPLTTAQKSEAQRLFNVNCAICHGEKMDGQGPLSTGGKIPAVANLTLKQYVETAEGTMFHVVTYGKGNMGSYAAQLTREERWMVISYVKSVQTGGAEPAEASDSTATTGTDSTAK